MKTDVKNNNYIDITNEWLKKATPNSHKITYI